MPEWIHNRAEHILAKNPSMPKSEAFAIATQQSHATGHSPKGFGTTAGRREAKVKFSTPKGDEQRANPRGLISSKMASVIGLVIESLGLQDKLGFSSSAYGGQPAQNGPGMKGHSQVPAFTAPPIAVKAAGVGVGSGMSASQYSGPLSYGPFKQESATPAFISPAVTKIDPRLEAPAYATGGDKTAEAATGAMSAAGRLHSGQRQTAPKLTGAGPSIAEIAKPKGFGKPLSGALKGTL